METHSGLLGSNTDLYSFLEINVLPELPTHIMTLLHLQLLYSRQKVGKLLFWASYFVWWTCCQPKGQTKAEVRLCGMTVILAPKFEVHSVI